MRFIQGGAQSGSDQVHRTLTQTPQEDPYSPRTRMQITRILAELRLHHLRRSDIEAITALAPAARTETKV